MAARRSVKVVPAARGTKCTCKPALMVVALLLMVAGIYALANGFRLHFLGGADIVTIIGWYFGGALAVLLAKMAKWKAFCCMKHKN